MDDDDEYLYGDSLRDVPKPVPTSEPNPIFLESNGLVAHLEEVAEITSQDAGEKIGRYGDEEGEGEEYDGSGDESDEVEFIMEPQNRSLDFRRSQPPRPETSSLPPNLPTAPRAAGLSLTTEYIPISRGGQPPPTITPSIQDSLLRGLAPSAISKEPDDGIDPNTLPPATAPPSAPGINPNVVGTFDGRSILEVDLSTMADKPWRRPGSDISDWFNYGFDELSWEAYCHRRRELGEVANVLKANVINFAGLQEDQLLALPPEVRTMVMTGASAMMNSAANQSIMAPSVMMEMPGLMGPMGMGMNGDIAAAIGGSMMQGMMADGASQSGQPGGVGAGQEVNIMQDGGFNPSTGAGSGMLNIGMGNDFVMQDQNSIVQQMYPVMETQPVQGGMGTGRGASGPFRGNRAVQTGSLGRSTRGFAPRGRGRGGIYGSEAVPAVPVRPASPLPPNVPTGPRNQNKYKDRDGNAPAVDGLDYGGGKDPMGRRTPSGEPEERISRKRRSSPGLDDIRGSKRR